MIGYALWALMLAAALALEGLGLTLAGHQWPTISDLLRSLTKPVLGRWIFFALWLWTGWHFFIRGWEFFLRGSGAEKPAGAGGGKDLKATIVQAIVPLLGLFVLFLFVGRTSRSIIASEDRTEDRAATRERAEIAPMRRPGTFVRYALMTSVAGYVLFVAVIGVFELIAGNSASGIFYSAVVYGAFLAFAVGLPCFFAITIVSAGIRRKREHHRFATSRVATPPDC